MKTFDVKKWVEERERISRLAFESWKRDNKEVIEELEKGV